MATLSNLPLLIHIIIARYLSLKHQIIYAKLSQVMHDAVEYVFSHVYTLDFTSILGPLPMNPERPRIMPLDCSMFLDIMAKHVRAKTIVSFQLPLEFPYNDTELINLLARTWKENFKHGVGHPNGQLENIFFAHSLYCGTSDKWESLVLRELLQPYLYETPDGTYACDYNPAADNFNKVPGWSTVDIKTPKESRIKPWLCVRPRYS